MPQFDNRNLKASHGLQKHDLSYRNAFTSHFGMLLPFCVVDVVGNSRVELSLEHQTRTLPLNSAAFVRLREHYDYFFVPYAQLFRQYDNFKTLQSNQNSMLDRNAYPNIIGKLPSFSVQSLDGALQLASPQSQYKDAAGYHMSYGASRLFDLLDYGHYKAYNAALTNPNLYPTVEFNPFRLLAYQKIYYDYYRNDKYEENSVEMYNIDDITNGLITTSRLRMMSLLRYRLRRKDYFTQVTPDLLPTSNQFNRGGFNGVINGASINPQGYLSSQFTLPTGFVNGSVNPLTSAINSSSASGDYIVKPENQNTAVNPFDGATVQTPNTANSQNVYRQSEIQHRLIESRQRLLERMYAAHSDFSSQMLAIYGYAPTEGRHGRVKHLGGFSELLSVSDVNNNTIGYQSKNDGTFGKVNSYGSSKPIKFHVPEDGIIMGIYSTDCMPDYSSKKVDRFNTKLVPEDYFNPYYEGLGKQALFSYEYCTESYDSSTSAFVGMPNSVLGFIPRYAEYKAKVDCVHNQLDYGGVYENYTSSFNVDMDNRKPMLSLENLINKPLQLNKVFYVDYDGTDETDCFLCNFYNQIKVLAPIRRNSEL